MADIQGLDELMKKLDVLPSLVSAKNAIARALRKGAEPIRARAQELAPDDPTTAGSRIKESMMIQISEQTATGAIAKIGPSRKGFVGQFQEWGTAHHSAQPFLVPAFEEKVDEATTLVGLVLAQEIEKAAK